MARYVIRTNPTKRRRPRRGMTKAQRLEYRRHRQRERYAAARKPDKKTLSLMRRYLAQTRRRRSNPAKFERCVRDVKRRGGAYNAYAVCNAALARTRKKRRNPARKHRRGPVRSRTTGRFIKRRSAPSRKTRRRRRTRR